MYVGGDHLIPTHPVEGEPERSPLCLGESKQNLNFYYHGKC